MKEGIFISGKEIKEKDQNTLLNIIFPDYRKDIEYKIEYKEQDGFEKVDYGYYRGQDLFLIQFYITNHKREKSYNKNSIHKITPTKIIHRGEDNE